MALPGSSGLGRCLSKQPFISAASFPKGKGTGIDYLFGAGRSSDWEAGGCWWLLAGKVWAQEWLRWGWLGARHEPPTAGRGPGGCEVDSDLF